MKRKIYEKPNLREYSFRTMRMIMTSLGGSTSEFGPDTPGTWSGASGDGRSITSEFGEEDGEW